MSTAAATTNLTGRWAVDPDATQIGFRTTAWLGLMKVRGSITAKNGIVVVDDSGAASGRIAVDATTIDTGNAKRDAHLNRADFFDTTKWPEATFTVDRITDADEAPRVEGELVIRDVPIRLDSPIVVRPAGDARVVEATVVVDHHAAGLPFRKPIVIHREATVTVSLTLVPA